MLPNNFISFFHHITWRTLKKTLARTIETRLLGLAAEIAFNAMLSLFPGILSLFTAISLFANYLRNTFIQLATQLSHVIPQEAWMLISNFATSEIGKSKSSSLFSLTFIIAIWTASGAISTAMIAFDQIQQIHPSKMRSFWKAKLISLGLTIGTILLLMLATFIIFVSNFILKFLVTTNSYLLFSLHLWKLLLWPLALLIVTVAFSFIYRYGPSQWIPNTPIFPGAILATLSWAIVSGLFRLYVSNFGNYNKIYGAIAAVIILMLWLWLSAFFLLVGNQLNITIGEAMKSQRSQFPQPKDIKKY